MTYHQNIDTTSASPSFSPSLESALNELGTDSRRASSPTPHLTVDQYACLLSTIDEVGGIATLDEISRALPGVEQPVSAVFDLCEADILCADWEAAFDADMRVRRVGR